MSTPKKAETASQILAEILSRLQDETDIEWNGGPNWAMRLLNEFGDRIKVVIGDDLP